MQVRKRLRLTAAFSVITAFVVLLMLLLSLSRIRLAAEESDIADDLIVSSFERSALREDYLRTGSKRAKVQWFAKHKEIGKLLKTLSEKSRDPQDNKLINEMIKDQESTGRLFSEIVQNREKAASGGGPAEVSQELENRLIAQMSMRLYDKILNGRRLRDAAEERLFSSLRFAGWCIFLVIASIVAAATINSLAVGRTIINRLKLLRDGVANIGSGDLNYRINIKGDDEFVALAESFNAMTSKLQRSYSDLKSEIAERKRTEKVLAETARTLEHERDILQEVMNGAKNSHLVYLDRDFNFVRVNETYAVTCGYRPEEMIGKNHFALYPEAENEAIFARVRDTGEPVEYHDKPFVFPDQPERGVTYWDWTLIPVKDNDGQVSGLIFSLFETTDRKRTEEELRQSEENLKNHVAELDIVNRELESFNYSISHDLRSPLRHISGLSQILLEKYSDKLDEEGKDFLVRNVKACQRMYQLTEDLLRLSRITHSEIRKEKVGLSSIAREIADRLSQAQPARKTEFVIADGLEIEADPDLIRILLDNLFENAWKFTGRTATARIEFGVNARSGEEIVYYVRDNGTGFDQQYASNLFRPFQRMHGPDDFPGSGIGLAIAHRIVSKHNGRIWAESQPDEGATFYFTL